MRLPLCPVHKIQNQLSLFAGIFWKLWLLLELKLNDLDLLIWDDTEILASKDYVNIQKFAKFEISNYVQLSIHIPY